ncbi:hypothetical protein [Ligilactobacillus ruminis]|nr:hypothetical protein [Ligilactobacillus ruminis]WDC79639.1 hypothetical protein PSR47_07620 [Ligilactobacillus ruminis]
MDKRYTIDVLSSGFLMNQTTLKAVFKKVSGKPIERLSNEKSCRNS